MVEQACPIIIYMISEVKTCNYGKIKIQHQTTNKYKLTSYKLHQSNILLLFSTVSALFEAPYTVYLPLASTHYATTQENIAINKILIKLHYMYL
jgi:hypothetical protein